MIEYKEPDKYVVVCEDIDLIPIKIYLPKPPPLELIDGYGLEHKDQRFKRAMVPQRLKRLERNADGTARTLEEIWSYLDLHQNVYSEEIDFIKKQWFFRLYGYWFFNNGKPTYITGKHYYYLNFWSIDVGYPQFRDRDRKYWIFTDFCLTDTLDFKTKDDKGNAIPDKMGYYHMYDLGRRVCLGFTYPKFRREGATYRASCDNVETISKKIQAQGGIQSRNDADSQKVFSRNLMPPFKKLPFFFKPSYTNTTNTNSYLNFDVINRGGRGGFGSINLGLESKINYEVGKAGAYDGYKLHFYHDDEVGKCSDVDVWERHMITKECLSESMGREIIGFTAKTSTAGELTSGGGEQFQKLCNMSNYYQRNALGQTASGLYNLFISSKIGLMYDDFGNCDEVKSEESIIDTRKMLLDNGDMFGWAEKVRQFPLYYRECFMSQSNDIGFNTFKLETRLNELRIKQKTIRGNFKRVSSQLGSDVVFEENKQGRFEVSLILPPDEANQKYLHNGVWYPFGRKFVAGGDSFKIGTSQANQTKTLSDGAGAVFRRRDKFIDPDTKDIRLWSTNKFVCTYLFRTNTTDEYVQDILMMCQYYSAMLNAESNDNLLVEEFTKLGFRGYLLYIKDSNGKLKNAPGTFANENNKQEAMLLMRNYIELHAERENHYELLNECKSITSLKKLTSYDLLAASIWALYGSYYGYFDYLKDTEDDSSYNKFEITNYFKRR